MKIIIEPQPKQIEAMLMIKKCPVTFYGGAKGGGKSYLVRAWQVARRLKYKNTHGVIIRKTYPDLRDNHIKKFEEEYPELMKGYISSEKIIKFPNGSSLSFRYLDQEKHLRNFQGAEFEDIAIDEITQHTEDTFKTIRSSNRTTKNYIEPRMLLTGNPGDIGHNWVKRIFIDRNLQERERAEDFGFVQAKVFDNKKLTEADPSYIQKLEDLPDKLRSAYLDGDWDVFAGQYYGEWSKDVHTIEPFEIPRHWKKYRAIDWGYSPDPAVCSWYAVAERGITYKYREIRINEMLPEDFGNYVTDITGDEKIEYTVADPSIFATNNATGESIAEQISRGGVECIRADNQRVAGWLKVRSYLKYKREGSKVIEQPAYQVFKTCIHTIRTYPEMIHDTKNPEDIKGSGLDDHHLDTDRYFFMSRPDPTPVITVEYEVDIARQRAHKELEELFSGTSDLEIDDDLGEYF